MMTTPTAFRRELPRALSALLFLTALACAERPTEPARREPRPEDRLPGAASAPAAEAIPQRHFVARAADYSTDHPQLAGMPLSFNTVLLALAPAATVGEVNALLDEAQAEVVGGIPGVAGAAGGILYLRLPTRTHAELEARLATLRQRPVVRHLVQDALLKAQALPLPSAPGGPPSWAWSVAPAGDNWGLEAIRAPQMWNLNGAIEKTGERAATATGVLDIGFDAAHVDLAFVRADPADTVRNDHGVHVAGTIGATFGNGVGVDGVSPFARLVIRSLFTGGQAFSELEALIRARPDLRVINASLAFSWSKAGIDTDANAAARFFAEQQGGVGYAMLQTLAARGAPLPVIVAAAGNDSDPLLGGFPNQKAEFGSPFTNAALHHGAAPIIVVEADSLAARETLVRSAFSNVGGHVSAPGSQIVSTVGGNGYGTMSGTSMAAPHVTGLVSYLYSLDPSLPQPTLTTNPVRDLIVRNAVPVAGAAPRIDAFATVMDLDRVQRNDRVLRMLTDIDDGTADGNRRRTATFALDSTEDADNDGGPGDGRVDMSDFRRFRDWLLQVESARGGPAPTFDAALDHPKFDVNGDGRVEGPAAEAVYARGDFNGDGSIHRTLSRRVPGALQNREVTDLEVLQAAFSDSFYTAAELPALLNSADLVIRGGACLARPGAVSVRTSIRVVGDSSAPARPYTRTHTRTEPTHVYTAAVHPAGYRARAEALDSSGKLIGAEEEEFPLPLGGDASWEPECRSSCTRSIAGNVTVGDQAEVDALRDVATITGVLFIRIRAPGAFGSVELPCLTSAGGVYVGPLSASEVSWAAPGSLRLPALDSVTGVFVVTGTPGLRSVEAPTLRTVGSGVHISRNADLVEVRLGGVAVHGGIAIVDSPSLTTLTTGPMRMDHVSQVLMLLRNPRLASLDGIASGTRVPQFSFDLSGFSEAHALAFANRITVANSVTQHAANGSAVRSYQGPPWH